MANYSLVINSKFRPFEYQELLAPVLAAEQAHQAVENQYAELAAKSSIWDRLTNPETDQRAHSIYSTYAADLERQADELARNGLNPSSRQQMLNMRARYARDITPIEAAYKRREEQIAEQRKLGTKMIYDFDAATTSLDRYLDNPSLSYNSIDRSDLYTRSVTDFSHYAKALADYGNGKKLDNFTNTFIQNYGISKDEARKFITDMRMGKIDEANPALRAVYDALYNSTGVSRWDSPIAQERVKETILEGVGAAIGAAKLSTYEDKGAIMAQQLANSKALARYQQQVANEAAEAQRLKMYDLDPTNYYSKDEVARENERINQQLTKWKKAGFFDDKGNLTAAGRDALRYNPEVKTGSRFDRNGRYIPVYNGSRGNYEFYAWANGVRTNPLAAISHGEGQQYRWLENYYRRASQAISNGELATGTANFQVYRQFLGNKKDAENVARKIYGAIGEDGKIYEAGALQNGVITEGEGYDAGKFAKLVEKSGGINYIINSPTTGSNGQQLIELTNGKKFLLPVGIIGNDTQDNLNAANLAIRNANSTVEAATNLNRSNAYTASILTGVTGTDVSPNDGTITVTW